MIKSNPALRDVFFPGHFKDLMVPSGLWHLGSREELGITQQRVPERTSGQGSPLPQNHLFVGKPISNLSLLGKGA